MGNPLKRVLLLGATGTLGLPLSSALAARFRVIAPRPRGIGFDEQRGTVDALPTVLDASQPDNLESVVAQAKPDFIVNCIAVAPHLRHQPKAADYIAVNSLFPHLLAEVSRKHGCHLLQISTDGVYSGNRGGYTEADLPDPPDVYGRSKLAGEVSRENCLTIRTSFFGASHTGRGLVEWLLASRDARISGFRRYFFTGLSISALSRAIVAALSLDVPLTGLYHVGGPVISKCELLGMLAVKLRPDLSIDPVDSPAINRSLVSSRFWSAIGAEPPSLQRMVEEVQREVREVHAEDPHRRFV